MYGLLSLVTLAATVSAQAVTDLIVPSSTPLSGCLNSKEGTFSISIVNATGFNTSEPSRARRSYELLPRQANLLTLTLTGGVLTDQANRTGYIASNYQFQFDGPVQSGAIYTAGWSICSNGTLALGGQAVFWQCLSGSFYNLYDRNFADHCVPIWIYTSGTGAVYSTSPPGPVSTGPDQNDIANGGGTQSISATSASAAASSTEAAASTTGSAVESVSSSASEAASSATAAASSASESAASVESSALAAQATSVPQQIIAWAAGVVGVVALL